MDRNEEFNILLSKLDETPLKLDFTLERALARKRAHTRKKRKAIFAPLGSVAAVLAVFVFLVNISPTFAYAAGRLPLLRELAQFVALSPSLSAAVENEYVQPIGLKQSANGISASVEYVIVDQKQLNVFYTLDSDIYKAMDATPEARNADGEPLQECSIASGGMDIENGDLRKITVDFSSGTMPDEVKLKLKIRDNGTLTREEPIQSADSDVLTEYKYEEPVFVAELDFVLLLDPNFTAKGEEIKLNKVFTLDGQSLTLTIAEIYPTQMRFTFDDNNENTAWMTSLEFYVENEKRERFEGISNGVSAYGSPNSPMMQVQMLESSFFSSSKHLAMHITGVKWLDKNMEKIHIDLVGKTAEAMPDGVEFEYAKQMKNGWVLGFSAPQYEENTSYQLWNWSYYDTQGKECSFNSSSTTNGGYYDGDRNTYVELPARFVEQFSLINYPYEEVWLCPVFSRRVTLETPLSIIIK